MTSAARIVVAGSRGMPGALAWIARGFQFSGWCPTTIISGGGGAVDEAAEEYARKNDVPFELFPADWSGKGSRAGFIRNREMAEAGDGLIAVWDGSSNGTRDMIANMKRLKKPVLVLEVMVRVYWEAPSGMMLSCSP